MHYSSSLPTGEPPSGSARRSPGEGQQPHAAPGSCVGTGLGSAHRMGFKARHFPEPTALQPCREGMMGCHHSQYCQIPFATGPSEEEALALALLDPVKMYTG